MLVLGDDKNSKHTGLEFVNPRVSNGSDDIFISKLDQDGNFIFAKSFGGTGADQGYYLSLDDNGNIYTTGWFNTTVDFDPGTEVHNLTSNGGFDIFISKLDQDGNFIFTKSFGGTGADQGYSLSLDDNGNIYTTGGFSTTVDFDPSAEVYNLTSNGTQDVFISKLDKDGNFIFAKGFGGTGTDVGNSLSLDDNGNIYTTGYFNNTADFNPNSGTYELTSAGGSDIFLLKLSQADILPDITTLTINEKDTETLNIKLNTKPEGNVTLNISSSDTDKATVDIDTLTFTPTNYDTEQNINITTIGDSNPDDESITITISVNDADSSDEYDNIADRVITTSIIDNKLPVEKARGRIIKSLLTDTPIQTQEETPTEEQSQSSTCLSISQNLKTGLIDNIYSKYTKDIVKEVKTLQTYLTNHDLNPGPLDGIFGNQTLLAVKKLQTLHNLIPDGYVGPLTRGVINRCE